VTIIRVYERRISRYRVKRGRKHYFYWKANIPKELIPSEDVFMFNFAGKGFIAVKDLELVENFAKPAFFHGKRLYIPRWLEWRPNFAFVIGELGPFLCYQIDRFSLWKTDRNAKAIIRELKKYADGIPPDIAQTIRRVKERQGIVKIIHKDKATFVELSDEKFKEEIIEKLGKGFFYRKRTRRLSRGKVFEFKVRLMKNDYLPIELIPVKKFEELSFQLKVELWEHQERALKKFLDLGRLTCIYPPGVGKTEIAIAAMQKIGAPTLIVTPGISLLGQWKERLLKETTLNPWKIGLYYGQKKEIKPITITTYESALDAATRFNPSLLILEECHHIPAEKYRHIAGIPCQYIIGLSATPYRSDGKSELIYSLAGPPFGGDWEPFYGKYISRPTAYVIPIKGTKEFYKTYKTLSGIKQLIYAATNPAKITIIKNILKRTDSKKTLIYVDYLEMARKLSRILRAPLISGEIPLKERMTKIEWFKSSPKATMILTRAGEEGIDIPDAELCINIAGFGERPELQRIGRIMRLKNKIPRFIDIISKDTREEELEKRYTAKLEEKGIPVIELYAD